MANYATGTGLTPLIIFQAGETKTILVVYAPASNYPNDETMNVYDFVYTDGDNNPQNYIDNGGSYSYDPPPPPPVAAPAPDPFNFQLAVASQSVALGGTIPNGAILFLASMVGVLNTTTVATLPYLQAVWAMAVAEYGQPAIEAQPATVSTPAVIGQPAGVLYGNCSDGVPIVQKIQAISVLYHCDLAAAAPSS